MPVDGLAGPGLVETSANTLAKRMVKLSLAFEKVVSKGGPLTSMKAFQMNLIFGVIHLAGQYLLMTCNIWRLM
jgi:hypothetical protein